MSQIICQNCNHQNPDGSKFCSNCGHALKPATHLTCPNCYHRNPVNVIFCDTCGTRLIKSTTADLEEESKPKANIPQPFSLPTRSPGATGHLNEDDLPDWLRTGDTEIGHKPVPEEEERLADWLSSLKEEEISAAPVPSDSDTFGFGDLGAVELPDWLQEEEAEETAEPADVNPFLGEDDLAGEAADPGREDTSAWLKAIGLDDVQEPKQGDTALELDWLSAMNELDAVEEENEGVISTGFTGLLDPATAEPARAVAEEASEAEDSQPFGVTDWLRGVDEGTTTTVDEQSKTSTGFTGLLPELGAAEEITTASDEGDDWLSALDGEQPTDPDSGRSSGTETQSGRKRTGFTDWLTNSGAQESQQLGETPSQDEQAFTDWLLESVTDEEIARLMEEEALSDEDVVSDADVAEAVDADFPDWLTDVGTDAPSNFKDTIPGWLAVPSEEDYAAATTDRLEESGQADSGLDWLADVDTGGFQTDWLSELEGEGEPAAKADAEDWEVAFESEEGDSAPAEADFMDFLELDDAGEAETAAPSAPSGFTDFLSSIDAEEEEGDELAADNAGLGFTNFLELDDAAEIETAAPRASSGFTDFLSSMEDESDEDEEEFEAAEGLGFTNFLEMDDSAEADTAAPAAKAANDEAWLDEMAAELPPPASQSEEAGGRSWLAEFEELEDEGSAAEDDWLSGFGEVEGSGLAWMKEEPAAAMADAAEDSVEFEADEVDEEVDPAFSLDLMAEAADDNEADLDWLSAMEQSGPPREFTVAEAADHAEQEDEEEEWPAAAADEAAEAAEWEADAAAESYGEDEDDFDAEDDFDDFSTPFEEGLEDISAEEEELFAELRALGDEKSDAALPAVAIPAGLAAESLAGELGPEFNEESLVARLGLSDEGLEEGELGDLVFEDMAAQLATAKLPKWLEQQAEIEEAVLSLEPAVEIPEWVQEREPGSELYPEAGTEITAEPHVGGPLDGVGGPIAIAAVVIPSAAQLALTANEFGATATQLEQAELLRQIARPELASNGARPAAAAKATRWNVTRLVLALLLLGAVLTGILLPGLFPAARPPVSASAAALHRALDGLNNQTVLVAFDYTPAYAGELDREAEVLLGQLAAQGNTVLALSQYPAGMATAAPLLDSVVANEVRLGYLPGGAVGLRQLADCLASNQVCQPTFGGAIANRKALTDVSAVLVFTGEQETIVNWVEQVGATVNVPLLFGVTEAARPVVRPYLSSGQVAGTLSGLGDATAYEQTFLSGAGRATELFYARQIAQLVVAAVMLVGSVVFLLRRKR